MEKYQNYRRYSIINISKDMDSANRYDSSLSLVIFAKYHGLPFFEFFYALLSASVFSSCFISCFKFPSIAATLFLTSAISVSSLQSNKLKSSVFQNCTFLNQKPCPCFSLFLPVTHLFFFQSILYKSCMCLICIQKKPYNITANDMSLKYDFQIDCSLRVYIIYNKYYKALYIFTISQHCGCNSQ